MGKAWGEASPVLPPPLILHHQLAAVCKELAKLPASKSYIRTSSSVMVYKASDSNSPKNPSLPSVDC